MKNDMKAAVSPMEMDVRIFPYHQPRALSQNAGRTRQADEPGAKFHQNGYHSHRKILPVRTIQCDDLRRMRKSI